jgi:hypothetical protein
VPPDGSALKRRPGASALGILALGVVVALAALLDLGPFAGEELSRAEFVARADQVCAEAHDEFRDLQRSQPETASEAEALTDALLDVAEDELADVAELNGPDDLDDAIDRYLEAREAGIELLRAGLDAAADQDALAYERAQARLASTQDGREKLAREVGFDECSRPITDREQLRRDAQAPRSTAPSAPPTVSNPPTATG